MKRHYFIHRFFILFGVSVMLLGVLAGCGKAQSNNGGSSKINIVAAEDFYGEVARAVGGNHVNVTSIINKPSIDPHEFEPTTATAQSVNNAKLVIYNGIGYDSWMDKLVSADQGNKKVLRVGEDLMNKKSGDNEHLWYDPETMPKLAQRIAAELAKLDPSHAKDYQKNANAYIAEIKPVKNLAAKLAKQTNNKTVDVSEPVFDLMLQALKYKISNKGFELAVENGSDPAPKDIAAMQSDIIHHRIHFFVENIQASDPTVGRIVALANKNNVPVVKVTETLPDGQSYKSWMLGELQQIEKTQSNR